MDRCREDGLGQQRDDGGGCAKDRKEWRALVHMWMIEFNASIFVCLAFFGPPSHALVDYHLTRGGVNCKRGTTTDNQGTGGWYMG